MLSSDANKLYPSTKVLVRDRVASRLHGKDAELYGFSKEAKAISEQYMGWADLASNPPLSLDKISSFAKEAHKAGLTDIVLIGQGGSTQAPMTITKYYQVNRSGLVTFNTLDLVSPVCVREVLSQCDPEKTLVIVSSKSGSTIEPTVVLKAVREVLAEHLPRVELPRHLVAITDPGSVLEKQAKEENWLAVFNGEPTVGGRFSALSVFGLLPAALAGIDIEEFVEHAHKAEIDCSEDSMDNPAIRLAAFLYDNYVAGRDKFCLLTPQRGRVLGLWIEQLVAESLGKDGKGILPNIEIDPLMLQNDHGDRSIITYRTKADSWDESNNFEMSMAYVHSSIPCMSYRIENGCELAEHFVMWEYAIAMCGYLMQVCPFDQPDVAAAKAATLNILKNGHSQPDIMENNLNGLEMGQVEVYLSECMKGPETLEEALTKLIESIQPGDYFCTNAFLPFTGEGRRSALEQIRHTMAEYFGVVSCLEIGPRYLHSTGQLHKGGPNTGVFLIISAFELKDIPLLRAPASSLASLAKSQAEGDLATLSNCGRRCVLVHLPDNSGATVRQFGALFRKVVRKMSDRA